MTAEYDSSIEVSAANTLLQLIGSESMRSTSNGSSRDEGENRDTGHRIEEENDKQMNLH